MEQNDERRILGQMVRFQNQAAVRIDNDCVKRREIALGGISPRNHGQEKEKKRLFHVPLLDIAVKPADASTDTANSNFIAVTHDGTPAAISNGKNEYRIDLTRTSSAAASEGAPGYLLQHVN